VTDDAQRLLAQPQAHGARRLAAREVDRQELAAIASPLSASESGGDHQARIAGRTGRTRVWIDELLQRHHHAEQT
jgi:hypothetical protein